MVLTTVEKCLSFPAWALIEHAPPKLWEPPQLNPNIKAGEQKS